MKDLSRREAIASIAAGSAGLVLSVSSESKSQDVLVRAFRGQHQPRPLSFDPTKLKGFLKNSSVRTGRIITAGR